jgi:hypothetical protein
MSHRQPAAKGAKFSSCSRKKHTMTTFVPREILRRMLVLFLSTLSLIAIAWWSWMAAAALLVAAIAVYGILPRIEAPAGAMTFERIPAVYGPDFLGFFMTSVFIALPFWARAGDGELWAGMGPFVHPSALLVWPLAAISSSILYFSARYAAFWARIDKEGITVHTLWDHKFIRFDSIECVGPYRQGLPKFMRWLTPFLILGGRYGAAGAILLARDSTGVSLQIRNGNSVVLLSDAFEHHLKKILAAFRTRGVPIDPEIAT